MKIKLLKPFGFSEAGEILNPDPPVAHLLIERGIAIALAPQKTTSAGTHNKAIKPDRIRNKHLAAS